MQCLDLRVEQVARFFEMDDRTRTISLPVLKHCEHSVAGFVVTSQTQQMLQDRYCCRAPCIELDLCFPLQGRNVVRSNTECFVKRNKCLFALPATRVGLALQRPQLWV